MSTNGVHIIEVQHEHQWCPHYRGSTVHNMSRFASYLSQTQAQPLTYLTHYLIMVRCLVVHESKGIVPWSSGVGSYKKAPICLSSLM